MSADNAIRVEARSRGALRGWLEAHHEACPRAWMITWKKHTTHYLSYGDLIEELLCWGWINSRSKGVDADRTSVMIAPRSPKSAWSAVNKAKVEAARASGAMTPAGEAPITTAQGNGMWAFLDDVERLEVPEDLARGLGLAGQSGWDSYPRHIKRGTLEWIKTAKTDATCAKRINDAAASAQQGKRPKPFR